MINPEKISNFNLTIPELEENILFWVCAAGKNGVTAAKSLDKLLIQLRHENGDFPPFGLVNVAHHRGTLPKRMKEAGIGCYNNKAVTFQLLASSALDLRSCTVDDLMAIKGIGPKTARAFLVHTREAQKFAVIDTHVLKFLRHQGIMAPKSTPSGKKYNDLERIFLKLCDLRGLEVADVDLAIWNHYRSKPNEVFDIERFTNDYHQRCSC
jgi:hypothetical protein